MLHSFSFSPYVRLAVHRVNVVCLASFFGKLRCTFEMAVLDVGSQILRPSASFVADAGEVSNQLGATTGTRRSSFRGVVMADSLFREISTTFQWPIAVGVLVFSAFSHSHPALLGLTPPPMQFAAVSPSYVSVVALPFVSRLAVLVLGARVGGVVACSHTGVVVSGP